MLVERWDPVALADGVASGRFTAARVGGRVELVSTGEVALPARPVHLLIARAPQGEVAVCELDADEGAGLAAGPVVMEPDRASMLLEAGMVTPEKWAL